MMESSPNLDELLVRFAALARAGKLSVAQIEMICEDAERGGDHLPKTEQPWRVPGTPGWETPRMWRWPSDGQPLMGEIEASFLPPPESVESPEPTKAPIPTWAWVLAGGTGIAGVGFGVLIGLAARYLIY